VWWQCEACAVAAHRSVRRVRQQPYAWPSRQQGVRLRSPSDDDDKVVGPAKVEERMKEEGKMDTGDAAKKEEHDGATKKEDATAMQKDTCAWKMAKKTWGAQPPGLELRWHH
jgi:hypothetical protein